MESIASRQCSELFQRVVGIVAKCSAEIAISAESNSVSDGQDSDLAEPSNIHIRFRGLIDLINSLLSKKAHDRPDCFGVEKRLRNHCGVVTGERDGDVHRKYEEPHTWIDDFVQEGDY
jgi:hypothetical protein